MVHFLFTRAPMFSAAAEAGAAKPPKVPKVKQPKTEKVVKVKDEKNGVVRPRADGICGKMWATADAESAKLKRPITRAELKPLCPLVNDATFSTQFARWATYHNVGQVLKDFRTQGIAKAKAEREKGEAQQKAAADKEKKAAEKVAAKEKADREKAEAKAKREAAKAAKGAKGGEAQAAA